MEYSKNLSEPWFSLIKLGLKKVEGRLIKDDFSKMGSGDYILFSNNEFNFVRTFRVMITSVCKYNSFEDYLQNETLENALPGIDTIEEGVSIYYNYYKKEDEEKYKIKAFRLIII